MMIFILFIIGLHERIGIHVQIHTCFTYTNTQTVHARPHTARRTHTTPAFYCTFINFQSQLSYQFLSLNQWVTFLDHLIFHFGGPREPVINFVYVYFSHPLPVPVPDPFTCQLPVYPFLLPVFPIAFTFPITLTCILLNPLSLITLPFPHVPTCSSLPAQPYLLSCVFPFIFFPYLYLTRSPSLSFIPLSVPSLSYPFLLHVFFLSFRPSSFPFMYLASTYLYA